MSPPCGKPVHSIIHSKSLEELERVHDEENKKLICYHCGIKCDLEKMVDERRDFLASLGAVKETIYEKPISESKHLKMNTQPQIGGEYYRLEFAKVGAISFISHLDLQKIMLRIFRRSEIDILYSQGYNPHPLFSFGAALTLGVSSLSEFFDLRLKNLCDDSNSMLDLLNSKSEISNSENKVPW